MINGNIQAFALGNYWIHTLVGVVVFWVLSGVQVFDEFTWENPRLSENISLAVGAAVVIPRLLLPFAVGYSFGLVAALVQVALEIAAVAILPERPALPGSNYDGETLPGW